MELIERVQREQAEKEALYEEMKRNPIDLDALFIGLVKTIHYDYPGFAAPMFSPITVTVP